MQHAICKIIFIAYKDQQTVHGIWYSTYVAWYLVHFAHVWRESWIRSTRQLIKSSRAEFMICCLLPQLLLKHNFFDLSFNQPRVSIYQTRSLLLAISLQHLCIYRERCEKCFAIYCWFNVLLLGMESGGLSGL